MECKKCGYRTNEEKQFCPECGNQLSNKSKGLNSNKPMNKKYIVFASIAMIIILSFIAFFFIGKGKFTPENTVDAFEKAVENKDTKALKNLINPVNDSFELTKENTSLFIEFLSNNPKKYDKLINRLNQQVESINTSGENRMAYSNDTYATVNIIKEGKKWWLFDNYEIVVVPMYLDLYMDTKDVGLFVNGNRVGTSTGKDYHEKFGPFMPGIHQLKATFDNSYVSSNVEEEVELFDSSKPSLVHTLKLDVAEVKATTRYDDSNLYINGKKTDIVIGKDEKSLGMFPTDESVKAHVEKEFPWGTGKSEELVINGDYLTFSTIDPLSEKDQEALLNKLNDTISQYMQALTKQDASVMKDNFTDAMKKDLTKRMKNINKQYPNYTGKLVKSVYDSKSLLNPEYDDNLKAYKLNIKTELTFHEPNESLGWLLLDEEKKQYTRTKMLTVIYDEKAGKWKLNKYEVYYNFIDEKDKITFTF
ncbi:zinc ribbon domain-containing protein [Virgibacillus ndiopensis]|uniref:zinc ribbon domain-containing protein n=1 Tax=Virgibacillus ndiopensis TaxID=2004408 RepID=UPI000C082DFC|nr:hypothetical protein [Virgibacillus ndiopensis]